MRLWEMPNEVIVAIIGAATSVAAWLGRGWMGGRKMDAEATSIMQTTYSRMFAELNNMISGLQADIAGHRQLLSERGTQYDELARKFRAAEEIIEKMKRRIRILEDRLVTAGLAID